MTKIHKTAIIDKNAKIHDSVFIGPYSIIGPEVTINADTIIPVSYTHLTLPTNREV